MHSPEAMENFWMYQVEKLELEEQVRQRQQTERHDEDEVGSV